MTAAAPQPMRLAAAAALTATVLLAGCHSGPPLPPAAAPTTPASTPIVTTPPTPTPSPPTPGVPTPGVPTPGVPTPGVPTPGVPTPGVPTPGVATPSATPPGAPATLRPGDSGPAVLALQRRLVTLGYWLGQQDGHYGSSTTHAVTAFQKASGLRRDGIAGPATANALDRAARPRPRSTGGRLVEIDLRRQLLLVVADGRVRWVMDTSTGAVAGTTPTGRHTVLREIDDYHTSPLGVLYRPKYFIRGVAVHGYPSVPPYPASHGCVRVTNAAMDWLWAHGALPIGGPVWVY